MRSSSLTVDDPAFRERVEDLDDRLRTLGGGTLVGDGTSYYQDGDESLVSPDRHTTLLLLDVGEDVESLEELVTAENGARGFEVLATGEVAQLVERPRHGRDPLEDLTEREREVLALMAEGRSNRAIGEGLYITEHTVVKHVKSIFGKLRLATSPDDHRRVLAVLTFLNSA